MEENKFLSFFSRHWSTLLMAVLCVAALGFFMQRRSTKHGMGAKRDYLVCHRLFERFQSGETLSSEATAQAEDILHRHPELTPKYAAHLATALLIQENPERAQHYLSSLDSNLFRVFSEGTLAIARKDFGSALTQAQALEAKLTSDEPSHTTLRGFNLLRLAFLAKNMGETELMQESYGKLRTLSSFDAIADLFKEGTLSLENYLTAL